jgi:hypothetical protein
MSNEHHASYCCMKPSVNLDAAVISKVTKRAKIAFLGNVIAVIVPVVGQDAGCRHLERFGLAGLVSVVLGGRGRGGGAAGRQPLRQLADRFLCSS